jgi:hypothetical protein
MKFFLDEKAPAVTDIHHPLTPKSHCPHCISSHSHSHPKSPRTWSLGRLARILIFTALLLLCGFLVLQHNRPFLFPTTITTDVHDKIEETETDATNDLPPPRPWYILTYNTTKCDGPKPVDKIFGTGPSKKCRHLGHGDDIESVHWEAGTGETVKLCYYEGGLGSEACTGKNTTVDTLGCNTPGYVGEWYRVVDFDGKC